MNGILDGKFIENKTITEDKLSQEVIEKLNHIDTIGVENLIAKKWILDWRDYTDSPNNMCYPSRDEDGEYIWINAANVYNYIVGLTAYKDVFFGKIKFKEKTQYQLKWKVKALSFNDDGINNGMSWRAIYTDGTDERVSVVWREFGLSKELVELTGYTNPDKTVSHLYVRYGVGNTVALYDIMLTEGTKAPEGFIPHKEDLPEMLHSEDSLLGKATGVCTAEGGYYRPNSENDTILSSAKTMEVLITTPEEIPEYEDNTNHYIFRLSSDNTTISNVNLAITLYVRPNRTLRLYSYTRISATHVYIDVEPKKTYHLLASLNEEEKELNVYLDGVFIGKAAYEGSIDNPISFSLGSPTETGAIISGYRNFPGTIHHARLFNYTFNQSDVNKFYNSGKYKSYSLSEEEKDSEENICIAEYLPSGFTQTHAIDTSGNGLNMVVTQSAINPVLTYEPLNAITIVNETGDSEEVVMSQKGVTDALADKADASDLEKYLPLEGGRMEGTINSQTVIPKTSATYNIGTTDYRWANGYINNLNSLSIQPTNTTESSIGTDANRFATIYGNTISGSTIARSGTASTVGTPSNPFAGIYAATLYENGTALSSKYLALSGGTLTGALNISSVDQNITLNRGRFITQIPTTTTGGWARIFGYMRADKTIFGGMSMYGSQQVGSILALGVKSTDDWTYSDNTNLKIYPTGNVTIGNNLTVTGTISEAGTLLSNKYLSLSGGTLTNTLTATTINYGGTSNYNITATSNALRLNSSGSNGINISASGTSSSADINLNTTSGTVRYNGTEIATVNDIPQIVEETGSNSDRVMSQKAVTTALSAKADTSSVSNKLNITSVYTDTNRTAIQLGASSSATPTYSIAIGYNASTQVQTGVTIGQSSKLFTTDVHTSDHNDYMPVSFGESGLTNTKRRLINVRDGVKASDAATVGQLGSKYAYNGIVRTTAVDASLKNVACTLRMQCQGSYFVLTMIQNNSTYTYNSNMYTGQLISGTTIMINPYRGTIGNSTSGTAFLSNIPSFQSDLELKLVFTGSDIRMYRLVATNPSSTAGWMAVSIEELI